MLITWFLEVFSWSNAILIGFSEINILFLSLSKHFIALKVEKIYVINILINYDFRNHFLSVMMHPSLNGTIFLHL